MESRQSSRKWGVLACFGAAAGLSQFLWLNFAPILSQVQSRYGVSESQAGLLLLVFPLVYVLLSVHAGAVTDRRGYRASLVAGTALMALFACARVYLGSFWVLLAAQTGIAIAQPYVVNAISKLVLDWFDHEQEALATGLGTMGMFIGMALGLAATPPLVESIGMARTMAVFVACWLWVQPAAAGVSATPPTVTRFSDDFKTLIRNPSLRLVFGLSFLGLGYFNGLTTWLEGILAPNGINSTQAGFVGGMLIFGGIVGSAVVPALSDRFRRRRPFLIACIALGCVTLYPLTVASSLGAALALAGVQGFFFLPAFALLLEICAELSGSALAGSATGLLMLCGNAGAVVVIVAMEAIKGDSPTFARAVLFLIGLLVLAVLGSLRLGETFRKK